MINTPLYPEGMARSEDGCNFRRERFFVFPVGKDGLPEGWRVRGEGRRSDGGKKRDSGNRDYSVLCLCWRGRF